MSCFIENLGEINELAYPLKFFTYPRLGTVGVEDLTKKILTLKIDQHFPDIKRVVSIQDDEEFLEETDIFVPPDGGYGWFVALGAFIALMWTAGTVRILTKGCLLNDATLIWGSVKDFTSL